MARYCQKDTELLYDTLAVYASLCTDQQKNNDRLPALATLKRNLAPLLPLLHHTVYRRLKT